MEEGGGPGPARKQGSGLSVHLLVKMKHKAHHWRVLSHEHVSDHAMALGFRTYHVGRQVEKHWGKTEKEKEASPSDGAGEGDLQTNSEAVGNLLNNCLGSGILAVPHAVKELGLGCAMVVFVISMLLNRSMLMLVMRVCDLADLHPASYNGVAAYAFGKVGRILVVITFVFMGFGCMVSYVAATSDAVQGLGSQLLGLDLKGNSTLGITNLRWVAMLLLFPPTYIRSLKSVALLSAVAFAGAVVMVLCVVGHCGDILISRGFPSITEVKWVPSTAGIFVATLPITMTVFSIQAGGSIILSSLKRPQDTSKVGTMAFVLAWVTNMTAGIPAYLTYLDEVPGDVLQVMTEPHSPAIAVAKVAVLILVVLSYMFMMIPCRVSLLEGLFRKNEGKQEASYATFAGVTTAVNICAVLVNKVCSDLSLVLGLTGAVAVNLVAFILPCTIYMKVRSKPAVKDVEAVPLTSLRNLPYALLACYGVGSMVSGVYLLLNP